jgi:hypothetical protein
MSDMQPITLFLDIDGVFTMLDAVQLPMERVGGIHVRPIPMANALLKAINEDERLDPIWLTSWDKGAHLWNERAETTRWPVAYHLSKRDERDARTALCWLFDMNLDRKLIAAQYFLFRARPLDCPVVWIEDGFAQETYAWAKERGNVRLVDTLVDPIRSQLLAQYDDPKQAAREFIETYFLRVTSEA